MTIEVSCIKIILDVVQVMCVGFPILFLFLWGNPYHRGFFCDDLDLNHPYLSSTVPSYILYIVGLVMNIIVMLFTEYLNKNKSQEDVKVAKFVIPRWLWNSYCVVLVFAFGAACSQLTTDILKYTVGRFRPHFLTMCAPNVCLGEYDKREFFVDFVCTNEEYLHNERLMKEMRLSFPSGHSSFSMYSMVYFAIYLQRRMTWNGSRLLRHTLQFLAIIAAIFTAMTRISDYKHHWSDVLSGLIIGSIVAILVARCASTLYKQNIDNAAVEMNVLNGSGQQV